MENISSLLEQSQVARKNNDWPKLEEISIRVLQSISNRSSMKEETLKEVIINYLSSIVGTGEFLTELSSEHFNEFQIGLGKLNAFLSKKPHIFKSIDPIVQAGREVALLSLNPTAQNRNKISKNLRAIARPDLSIVICLQILDKSRLNYYALTVLCGAYCDLGNFDKAIDAAEIALKHSPVDGKSFVLNTLVRAHTLKFKSTGDFSEISAALNYANESIDLKLDSYSANAYVAAAIASLDENEIEKAKSVLAQAEPELKSADINALIQSVQAIQISSPTATGLETIDELDDDGFIGEFDSLFDLVERDEGFTPEVQDIRQMIPRFKSGGWFLQGLSNVPCPTCEKVALHSYRKHFGRYGKEMHYWGLVCDICKTATDSKDFDRKAFSFIASDLEENFPVIELCSNCKR
jgi:tetratricopeptide (TPR) repeat protein